MAQSVCVRQCFRIEWRVRNFSWVNKLESQTFIFSGTRYKLLLTREGTGKDENISIDMSRSNSYDVHVKTFFEDKNRQQLFSCKKRNSEKNCRLWFWFVTELRKNEGTFLCGGNATIVCEVTSCEREEAKKIEKEVSTQTDLSMETVTNLECLSRDVQHLLDDNLLTDITLKCGDRTIPAHRKVLSARSEVFLAMLRSDMTESRTGIVEIPDMEPSTLDQLVQYIYSGEVSEMSVDGAQQLYAAADKYAIESLKTLCGNFMKEHVTEENACNILVLAEAHDDDDLKDRALSAVANTDLVRKEENWFGFHKKRPKLATDVLISCV